MFTMLVSDTKCQQANRLAVSSASHFRPSGVGKVLARRVISTSFLATQAVKISRPCPFPSTVIDRDRCFQNFITLFSEEETAFFIRLKTGINNISKEKFYHLPAYVRFLSPHEL